MSKTVGEYQLKEKIGKGSYADVYKGTHKITGLKYAIKTISKDILSEPKLLAGLESEIKIMREFVHPNIVCLHEYFSSEKNFYLILELCEGGDLSKFIKKRKRIDERLAHNFLTQITSGLAFLHEKNFIHRDLKPANVLLSEFSDNAVLKLADFGFARQLTVASLAQTRCGTPLYMAPEILESKDYDGKADIWSVGCIFYEMLVGTSPFKGANEGDLLMNIKTKELNVPNDVVLSEVSLQILIKLLERYPLRRAALPQLVALCAHITSNPPPLPAGSSSSGAGGEETGLALPIPSPTSAENRSGGDMHQSARGRTPEGPTSAEPRRRSSTSSIPGDGAQNTANNNSNEVPFISPVKAPTREYPGGPAVGNLRGMFAPGGDGNPHTPPPPAPSAYPDRNSNTYSPSHQHQQYQSHQDSQQQNTQGQGQGHARRPSGTHYDPQVSKTVRAPYANPNNPLPHKYPSPSSSPPNSSGSNNITSGAGFSMQTTTHNNNNTNTNSVARSAPTGSVASSPGTIGMMGNLIAYVFNPSPSPPSVMSESARAHAQMKHQQQQQQQQQQGHGRSVSLDRATPPSFGNNNNNFGAPFGNGGGGTPPPAGSRARQQSAQGPQYTQNTTNTANNTQSAGYVQGANRVVREDHFAFADQDSLYSAARDNAHNNYNSNNYNSNNYNYNNNSSSNLSDEDFVMIDKSATERNDARTPTNPNNSNTNNNNTFNNQHYQYPHGNQSQSNSQSTSSYSGGNSGGNSGNNSTGLMGVVPPPAPTQAQPRAAYDTNTNTNPSYPTNPNNTSPHHYQQQQQQQLQQQQSYHLEREVRTHESAAMHAFYASIVQRCEVCCAVVAAVSALGDQHVRETLSPQGSEKPRKTRSRGGSMDVNSTNNTNHTNNENGTESEDEDGIAGFLQQPGSHDSRGSHTHSMQSMSSNHSAYFSHHAHHAAKPQQAVVDRYLTACSLYLHALSILANLLRSFDGSVGSVGAGNNGNNGNNNIGGEQAEPMRGVMQKLKADVTTVFEQLIARAEGCQKHIDSLVNPTQSASVHALSASKYTLPQAEPVMVQAALRRESDAAMEELLGNLNLASKLYASANELIEGVALTAHDPEDQRKLRLYSASLLDKHHSCRRRAEELGVFS